MKKLLKEHYNNNYKVELFDDESEVNQNKTKNRYRVIVMDNNCTSVFERAFFATEDEAHKVFWERQEEFDKKSKEQVELEDWDNNR